MSALPVLVTIAPPAPSSSIRSDLRGGATLHEALARRHPELMKFVKPWQEFADHPDDAHWLILVDAHADFQQMCRFFDRDFAALGGKPGTWSAAIAFTSESAHSLTQLGKFRPEDAAAPAATSAAAPPAEAATALQNNSLFVKMVRAYRWGRFANLAHVPAYLERLQSSAITEQHRQTTLFHLDRAAVAAWQCDLDRLWDAASTLKVKIEQTIRGRNTPGDRMYSHLTRDSFLTHLAVMYLYGRVEQDVVEHLVHANIGWLKRARGVYHLQEANRKLVDASDQHRLTANDLEHIYRDETPLKDNDNLNEKAYALLRNASVRLQNDAKIWMINHLRDLARCLASGAAVWAADSKLAPAQPIRVLAIKDYVRHDKERQRLDEEFERAFRAAFRPGDVTLDCFHGEEKADDPEKAWERHEWWQRRVVFGEPIDVQAKVNAPGNTEVRTSSSLLDYDIILIEMEHRTLFVGVSIVQWLAMAFDELEQAERQANGAAGPRRRRPQIIALSRDEKPVHSFICLSHGAEAFASKTRIFAIPALLTTARVGRRQVPIEPRNARPNFRVLYGLLPDVSNRLRSQLFDDMILGDEWDRRWLKALPKADLHFHIGTSISPKTITALAYNSSGYVLQCLAAQRAAGAGPPALLTDVCKSVILANLVSDVQKKSGVQIMSEPQALWGAVRLVQRQVKVPPVPPQWAVLDQAIDWLTPRDRPYQMFESCSLLVAALDAFAQAADHAREHRLGLCATLADAGFRDLLTQRLLAPWSYLGVMASMIESTNADPLRLDATPLGRELANLFDYFMTRADRHWKHAPTRTEVRDLRSQAEQLLAQCKARKNKWPQVAFWWTAMWQNVQQHVARSVAEICGELGRLLERPKRASDYRLTDDIKRFEEQGGKLLLPPDDAARIVRDFAVYSEQQFPGRASDADRAAPIRLCELTVVPETDGLPHDQRSLARYLWGAGMLGAEHLQFPENLLLSAFDVVRQNVEDNVVYSEIRCATNGYGKAGLNPQDATDLLCLGFDFAAMFFGWCPVGHRLDLARAALGAAAAGADLPILPQLKAIYEAPPQRWVRTNVILGAKRHKEPKEFDEIVSLVRSYLDRGREPKLRINEAACDSNLEAPGSWWNRCLVVGFDLSGDETQQFKGLREKITPLFVVSAPITIHAGEAATAESIWDAVYSLGAVRIGHGLRLRDDQKLLQYCSRRGICMELCPISNMFTNIYRTVRTEDAIGNPRVELADDRTVYPLRAFLDAGLDVCINTDNRSLHAQSTLTDEYLEAARVGGGLTRWETLKIVKAGFKCAFMSKPEVADLIRHVEYEVYKLVSDHDSDFEFRIPGSIVRREQEPAPPSGSLDKTSHGSTRAATQIP